MLPRMHDRVGEQRAGQQRLADLQRVERRRAVAHPVGVLGAVGDQVDAELAARRLDRRVRLARRRAQHLGAPWRCARLRAARRCTGG